jgi:predicted nucleic acid-binding protein
VAFVVVYDACVLFPNRLRDLLVRLARTGLFQAKWSNQILDEVFASVLAKYATLDPERLARTRRLMTEAVRDCIVDSYDELIGALKLPDPNDRHVVAAAIRCGAQVIVTFNLTDFPDDVLAPYDLEAQHPDDFIHNLVDLDSGRVARVIEEQARVLKNPAMSASELLDGLVANGLPQSVAALRAYVVDAPDQ